MREKTHLRNKLNYKQIEEVIDGKKTRILTLDPADIEFYDVKLTLQTKEYFEEGSSNIKIERNILSMSDPNAEVYLDEYITACYGTTEYPEDMTGITLTCEGENPQSINYEYKCRDAKLDGATAVSAVIPAIQTKVSLTPSAKAEGYIEEGYAFSPMFKLGYKKQIFIAASAVSSEVQRKRYFRATRMSARSTRLCTRDSTSSILIKVVISTLLL